MASKRSQNVKSRNKHWLLNWREAGIFTGIVSAQKRSHPCSKSRQLNALSHTEVTSYFNSKPDIFTGAVKWQCTKHCNTNTDVKQKRREWNDKHHRNRSFRTVLKTLNTMHFWEALHIRGMKSVDFNMQNSV